MLFVTHIFVVVGEIRCYSDRFFSHTKFWKIGTISHTKFRKLAPVHIESWISANPGLAV